MFHYAGYNLPMNSETVITAVSQSLTKVECLNRLGLTHNSRNFIYLNKLFQKYQIDTSHFTGIPASVYCRQLRPETYGFDYE